MTSDVPLAPFGGWPILALLIVLVILFVAALRYAVAPLELEVVRAPVDPAVVDVIAEHEGALLGAWTFFDWQDAAPELA